MPKKLRVKLEPVLGSARDGGAGVAGVRVVLTRHGPELSSARWNEKAKASLAFQARRFEKARQAFLGLPTLGKRYTLMVLEGEGEAEERPVFSDLSVTEIVEAIERDRETLVEAEPDPDERTANLDKIDQEGDSGVAVA